MGLFSKGRGETGEIPQVKRFDGKKYLYMRCDKHKRDTRQVARRLRDDNFVRIIKFRDVWVLYTRPKHPSVPFWRR
mgnify:CR=1 FL=1